MKTLNYIKLNESGVANVVSALHQLLADFQVYYTNLRGFHWNIKGHGFFVLHEKFEEIETKQGRRLVFRVRFTNLDLMRELAGNPHIKYSYFGRFSRELWKSSNP